MSRRSSTEEQGTDNPQTICSTQTGGTNLSESWIRQTFDVVALAQSNSMSESEVIRVIRGTLRLMMINEAS